ncbi:hypothetical protein FN846DRAFT_746708 [Sphaerosporella brunnea]|uniref:Uncharacterized protein n=1 Tax=Sphaerosporella brunnea TaxID=1250544 RepID=A0A5J5EVI6_9PEZI|nr:hypothetical protein FN846DRAFT_746708 [Sphaerosporella brunnea]
MIHPRIRRLTLICSRVESFLVLYLITRPAISWTDGGILEYQLYCTYSSISKKSWNAEKSGHILALRALRETSRTNLGSMAHPELQKRGKSSSLGRVTGVSNTFFPVDEMKDCYRGEVG